MHFYDDTNFEVQIDAESTFYGKNKFDRMKMHVFSLPQNSF